MRILEKIVLVIYSFIVLSMAIILSLIVVGCVPLQTVEKAIMFIIKGKTSSIVLLSINVIFILLSIKCIFFRKSDKRVKSEERGILLQNDNGKLIISKDTIENLVNTIIKQFETVEGSVTSITLNNENNLIINLCLSIGENVIIKELSINMQEKIKTEVKTALDLDVKEVNIKIKNYTTKKETIEQQ